MITSYEERFGRGVELDHAYINDNLPRVSEAQHLYKVLSSTKAKRILNVPFDGNLLGSVVKDEELTFADFMVTPTTAHWNVIETDTKLRGIPRGYFDAIISIAGIHHLTDQEQSEFILASRTTLKRTGRLLMVEVKENSPTSRFLDGFVGRYTATGHVGNYLKDNFVSVVSAAGYGRIERESMTHDWVFPDTDHLYDWMMNFFGLSRISKQTLLTAVNEILGMSSYKNSVVVDWELDYIIAEA
jgi:hypothetical protein